MFGPKGNGLRDCLRYEEALKEHCKEDFGPYDSKNECILVNLYGVDYESFMNAYDPKKFCDSAFGYCDLPAAGSLEPAARSRST